MIHSASQQGALGSSLWKCSVHEDSIAQHSTAHTENQTLTLVSMTGCSITTHHGRSQQRLVCKYEHGISSHNSRSVPFCGKHIGLSVIAQRLHNQTTHQNYVELSVCTSLVVLSLGWWAKHL